MGHKRNTIPAYEHRTRSMVLLNQGNIENHQQLNELFFLYNDIMEPRKQEKNCAPCRAYVWKRLKGYYGV